jgi:broad specificity phosphatase PhoE
MRKPLDRLPAFIIATVVLACTTVAAASPVTTVILVRHAEKTAAGPMMSSDVPLSEAGLLRAAELVRVLGDAGITAIYTTPYERTRRTAAPLAAKLGLQPIEIAAGKDYAELMAKEIREKDAGRTVLIVGHSNTTPDLMRKLGVSNVQDMADSEYDNLYIVTLGGTAPPGLVRLHYGAPAR